MKDIPFESVKVGNAEQKPMTTSTHPAPDRTWHPRREGQEEASRPNVKELLPWVKQLPPEVRPKELIIQYARIANKIAELWKHPHACEKYLNGLMIDERGTRKGFPPEVAYELAALQMYFNTHVLSHNYGVWGDRLDE